MRWTKRYDEAAIEEFASRAAGRIVTAETVSVPIINGNVDATGTRWVESANDDAPYAFILRLYTMQEESCKEKLGECARRGWVRLGRERVGLSEARRKARAGLSWAGLG